MQFSIDASILTEIIEKENNRTDKQESRFIYDTKFKMAKREDQKEAMKVYFQIYS